MAKSAYDKLNDLSDAWETEDIMEVVDDVKDEIQSAHNVMEEVQDKLHDILKDFEEKTISEIREAIDDAVDELNKSRRDLY